MPNTWQEIRDAEINHGGTQTGPVPHDKSGDHLPRPTKSEIMASVMVTQEEAFPEPDYLVKDPSHDF